MSTTIIPSFDSIAAIRDWLAQTTDYEKMTRYRMKRDLFDLGRVERFMNALERPHAAYACVHVAGTNGKGSVTCAIEALLRAHGLHGGRYTSPHLERETERIAIDGREITENAFVATFREMAPALARFQGGGDALTWFEIMTAAAFLAFRAAGVDVAVLETGLGGRLDATNIVTPEATVITSIGHDHHDKLGPTLADVAYEKAGIIKPGVPLVTGDYDREALDVVLARARELDAPARRLSADFCARNIQPAPTRAEPLAFTFELAGRDYRYRELHLPGGGRIQASNAALAVETLHALARRDGSGKTASRLLEKVDEAAVRRVLADFALPGRCEYFAGEPPILLDVGHTPEAARETRKTYCRVFHERRRVLMMALAQDKEVERIMAELAGSVDAVIFTEFGGPRATPVERLVAVWSKFGGSAKVETERDARAAYAKGLELAGKDGALIIGGSFYLAGKLRSML